MLANIANYVTDTIVFAGTKIVEIVGVIGTAGVEVIKKVLLVE